MADTGRAELPVLLVPALYVAGDALLDWLRDYAEAGGHLVLGPRTGYADTEARAEAASPALLRDAFGLTKAEAGVVARAASGEGVPALAASLAISEGTARLHLHRVFEKTGVHRQAELALVLARLQR